MNDAVLVTGLDTLNHILKNFQLFYETQRCSLHREVLFEGYIHHFSHNMHLPAHITVEKVPVLNNIWVLQLVQQGCLCERLAQLTGLKMPLIKIFHRAQFLALSVLRHDLAMLHFWIDL